MVGWMNRRMDKWLWLDRRIDGWIDRETDRKEGRYVGK